MAQADKTQTEATQTTEAVEVAKPKMVQMSVSLTEGEKSEIKDAWHDLRLDRPGDVVRLAVTEFLERRRAQS